MDICFLPVEDQPRSVASRLSRVMNGCHSVKGSVAFWTLGAESLDGSLLQALRKPESEMCGDMQWPTDYGKLSSFYEKMRPDIPSIYICLRKNSNAGGGGTVGLLHTKQLVFDLGGGLWEIWVGSHNFTEKAIGGTNLEGGMVVRGHEKETQFNALLQRVRAYQEYVKSACTPFDPNRSDFYESLRGRIDDRDLKERLREAMHDQILIEDIIFRRVLTLQSEKADKLEDQNIILMGNLPDELSYIRQRNRGGEPIVLRVRDSITKKEYTYEGGMRASDTIDNVPSSDVAFNSRRWAIRKAEHKGQQIIPPTLMPIQDVKRDLIKANRYYINIQIVRRLTEEFIGYFTYPETDAKRLWQAEPQATHGVSLSDPDRMQAREPAVTWVPVEEAEERVRVRAINWGTGFVDDLLERRIIVIGQRL